MPEIQAGLKGVYLATSEASFIDGDIGKLLYRGYDIHDLAEKSSFEETAYLLLYGKLPTKGELAAFDQELRNSRSLPPQVIEVIRLVKDAHPMDVLRTAVSAVAAYDPDVKDNSEAANTRKGIRLTAQAPTIVAAHHRIRSGLDPIPPDPNLNHAGNFLKMLFGKDPDPEDVKVLDVDFVIHAEHGANASAFTARVVASTISDLHSAVVAAIGALKGPAHGGAAESVMLMSEEIGSPDRAEAWVKEALATRQRIMGFGHRVYRVEDPRAQHLRDRAKAVAERKGEPKWYQILEGVYNAMTPYQSRGIYVNVDFYAGAIYYLMGIPEDLFISIFAMGRVPGWVLQCQEQFKDNILIRPLLEYNGPMDVPFVPIESRE